MRFRVTVAYEYEVEVDESSAQEVYGCTDPKVMALVDQENLRSDPGIVSSDLAEHPYTVTVEAVD